MVNKIKTFQKILVGLGDLLVIHLGILLTFYFRYRFKIPERNLNAYKHTFAWISISFMIIFVIYDMYNLYNKKMEDYVASILVALVLLELLIMALSFFAREFAFPRTVIALSYFFILVLMLVWRYWVYRFYIKNYGKKVVMIIGEYEEVKSLFRKMIDEYKAWHEIKYIISPTKHKEITKHLDEVEVVYFVENNNKCTITPIIKECLKRGRKVFVIPTFRDMLVSSCIINNIDDVITFNITKFELKFEEKLIKRLIDISISLIGIIIFTPFMIIIAILVKLTSKGPILYKQVRLTEGMKKFEIYKFRTMNVDAEKESGPILSSIRDNRITCIGSFLRRFRLDELPQLFNVVKGEMSIVGPRPERPFFVEKFANENEDYLLRFRVKAGLTGLAQVKGRYNTNVWDKLKMDLIYIKNYSFLMDIKILFLTLRTLVMKSATEGINNERELDETVNCMNYSVLDEYRVTILGEKEE